MDMSMWLEYTVTFLGLLYIVLIAREIRFGWIVGTIGSALFVVSNIQQHLYMDCLLNSYYVIMGIYGWLQWGRTANSDVAKVSRIILGRLGLLLALCILLTIAYGLFLNSKGIYTDHTLPYLDAGVTSLSFLATWMAAKKYIENWLLWLVADPLAMLLYKMKYYPADGWWLYPALFFVYTVMAAYGYFVWKKGLEHAS
jgi:nicotinamide mononucleotide transporter